MKHHVLLGKLAEHFEKSSARGRGHSDACDDADPHKAHFGECAKAEAALASTLREAESHAAADMPEVETFAPQDPRGTKAAGGDVPDRFLRRDVVPISVRGVIPDNEDWKKSLEDRGLTRVPRFGSMTEDEIAAQRLEPELRKLVSDK